MFMFSHIYYNFKLYLYINSTLPRLVMLVAVYSYLSLINFHYLIKINQLEKSVAIFLSNIQITVSSVVSPHIRLLTFQQNLTFLINTHLTLTL